MAEGRTIRTPKKGERLLAKLALGYSVTAACTAEHIGRSAFYAWTRADPTFAKAVEDAIESGTDVLEDVARRRAVSPEHASDTLLIFLLKARRPDTYRERYSVELTVRQVRERAERIAADLGLSVDDVLAEAEAIVAGTVRS